MRTATPLNIETQPGVGMGYVIRHIKSKKLVRASTTCQRDIDRRGSKIKALRAFSGDEPFFTVKIGSLHTEITVLKFLCGKNHKKCRDETGTYEWTGISLSDARKQKLEFSEPGYVVKEEAPKVAKVKKTKTAKVAKVSKGKRGRPAGSKNKVTDPVAEVVAAGVVTPAAPVEAVAPEAPVAAKPVQTDAEFESELSKEFESQVAEATAKNAARAGEVVTA